MSEGQRQNRRQGPPSSTGRADVVIAGAGFVGTALAILLAEAGLDVVLPTRRSGGRRGRICAPRRSPPGRAGCWRRPASGPPSPTAPSR
jgi:glycine/D-amino acid oxidase-like deaminating enzyme